MLSINANIACLLYQNMIRRGEKNFWFYTTVIAVVAGINILSWVVNIICLLIIF